MIITVPNSILEKIQTIQKTFLWYSSKPKIEDGDLKNVDVKSKTISLQCCWVKKLYDGNHHDWKVIPLYFVNKYFGKKLIFIQISLSIWLWLILSQSSINKSLLHGPITLLPIPKFHLAFNPIFYGTLNIILIDNKRVYLSFFSDKNVNYINNFLE